MSPILASYVVIAAIAGVVACHHLLVSIRRRDLAVHRTFAALAGTLALHAALIVPRFDPALEAAIPWLHWVQWFTEMLALALLTILIERFTRIEPSPFARWSRVAIAGFALIHLVLAPQGLARAEGSTIELLSLPSGELFWHFLGPLRLTYFLFAALTLAILGWSLAAAWRHARSGQRLRGYALLAALVVVAAAVLNSFIALDLLDLPSYQLIDHSFVALAVVMSLIMSDEMVQAGRLQGQLAAREADLRSTLDAINDGVVAVDHQGLVVRLNPAAIDLLAPGPEPVGRPIGEILRTVDRDQGEAVALPLREILAGEAKPAGDPVSLDVAGQRVRDVLITGAPVRRRDGVVTGAVLVIRDVTERLDLEEQLLQSRKMDALGQLAGGIAHDFNNMLSGIMGGAELLSAELADRPALKQRAEIIADSAERAGELTRQLLAFARRGKMVKRPMSVHECIAAAMALFRGGSAGAIVIEQSLEAVQDVVRGDAAMFQNAILNLAVNARDAMRGGGTMTIATRNVEVENRRVIEIEVADDGSGMPVDVRDRIFEPFFTTKQEGSGTGLGLAAVYGTVQGMEGTIRCDSEPGRGSVFTVTLPLDRGTVTVTRRIRTPSSGEISTGRILVVDDEEIVRTTTVAMLRSLGYTVDTAENGERALERFGDGSTYDLVVLDVVMPGMGGDEVYHHLKQRSPEVRCVVVSGYTRDTSIDQMRADGVEAVLIKPFRIDDLAAAMRRAIC